MTTAQDIIKGALRNCMSYQSGDQLDAPDAADCLEYLNDLLGSLSTEHNAVFGSLENILYFTGGKYQYTIGIDPTGATTADFKVQRPLRITNAFTRITTSVSGYDYPIDIIDQDQYVSFGLKSIPYPWPTALWYNNTYPLGTISFYGAPTGGGELHLFTDTVLGNLTLNQNINMPQGYARALKWLLAKEICSPFGFPLTPAIEKMARESWAVVKALNAVPATESTLDGELLSDRTDASWILYGGYR